MSKHNYTNPSIRQDLAHVEAEVTKGKKYYDDQGWEIRAPISDRECIYKALDNARQLAGLDRKQVARLCEQFDPGKEEELDIESEYPPL
tara:strand:- start:362 stop:628 length:267 start_codon:yes stop_codon:yes gene_type:complete